MASMGAGIAVNPSKPINKTSGIMDLKTGKFANKASNWKVFLLPGGEGFVYITLPVISCLTVLGAYKFLYRG